MAASTASPSSLFSTYCIFPTRGKCAAGSSVWTLCNSASSPHRHAQICPQIFTNLWCAQHNALDCSSFPSETNHRFRLYSHTLHYCADHTRRFDPFVHSVWNGSTVQTNLQQPACRFPDAAFTSFLSTLRPTHYLADWFSSETSLSRASLLDARLPVVHLQRLGWSLASATIFNFWLQFCASTCRLPPNGHTRTPHGHTGLPQSGCSHRALTINSSHVQTQATEHWRARTTTEQSR